MANEAAPSIPVGGIPKPVNPAADAPLGSTLYPGGGEDEKGGGEKPPVAAPVEEAKPAEPAPEAKPAEEKPPEGEAKPEGLTVAAYEKLELPKDFTPDEKSLGSFKELAAKHAVPPEAAQELLNLYGETMKQYVETTMGAQQRAWSEMTTGWTKELQSMPEFQGERKAQSETVLGAILDEFGGADKGAQLRSELNATWMGDNPRLVKLILDMGKALVEDEPPPIGNPPGGDNRKGKSLGQIVYPNQPN